MTINNNKIVTHNNSFHADDIFACASFSLLFEKRGETFEVIRTRDAELIKNADYVFDVGGIYDPALKRFDHHQVGGAGKRSNGIEYSSFGLVWKEYGKEIAGNIEVQNFIEQKLVMPVDANDNGIDLYKTNFENISPYKINDVFAIFAPTALEKFNKDEQFLKAVVWAKEILTREIKKANDEIEVKKIIQNFYENSEDKRLVVVDEPRVSRYEIWNALQDFNTPLFAVYGDGEDWSIVAMRMEMNSHQNRKDLPSAWAGLKDEELQKITGVPDAIFCHRGLFLAGAKSKEGAIKLAKIVLES
ncbi:MAG: MYG1 family protein [Minisyncoccia bacterium]